MRIFKIEDHKYDYDYEDYFPSSFGDDEWYDLSGSMGRNQLINKRDNKINDILDLPKETPPSNNSEDDEFDNIWYDL